jgi:RNA polymerase-binding protein DksA
MKKKDLKTLKKLLEQELAEVTRGIETTRSGEASHGENRDNSAFVSHPADISGDTIERERSVTMLSRNYEVARKIEEALKRLESGAYGDCESCGADIPLPRLKAKPHARLCIECQEEQEKGK